MTPLRQLTYRYLSLAYEDRLAIAIQLHLIHEEDRSISEVEQFRRIIARAKEQKRLRALWDRVNERFPADDRPECPFPA